MASLLTLPNELLLKTFHACPDIYTVLNLAATNQRLRNIWIYSDESIATTVLDYPNLPEAIQLAEIETTGVLSSDCNLPEGIKSVEVESIQALASDCNLPEGIGPVKVKSRQALASERQVQLAPFRSLLPLLVANERSATRYANKFAGAVHNWLFANRRPRAVIPRAIKRGKNDNREWYEEAIRKHQLKMTSNVDDNLEVWRQADFEW